MLQIFKDNQLFNALLVIPYLLVLSMNSWLLPVELSFSDSIQGSLSTWLFSVTQEAFVRYLLFFVVVLFQAYLFNGIINFFKLAKSPTYISAVCFVLLHFIGFDIDVFNPLLLANTFLLLALYSLFASYNKKVSMSTVFNIGFFIGLAVLFYHSHIVYFYWSLFAFLIVRSFDLKEFLILISGFLVPLFLMATYQFLQNNLDCWLQADFYRHYGPVQFYFEFDVEWYIVVVACLLIYSMAITNIQNIYFKTSAKEKKFISCLFIMPVFSALSYFLQSEIYHFHFASFIISISALLSLSLHSFKNQLLVEAVHFVLFMTCLGIQYQDLFFK